MKNRAFLLIFWTILLQAVQASPPVQFILDAPNGAAQSSTVLHSLQPGEYFNIYITPLEQHLGDSLYATEIQINFGDVGIAFSRMDPRIINKRIDDPEKLPPIWETRAITRGTAISIEDPRIVALGSAGISLEKNKPFLVQATYKKGILRIYHRPLNNNRAYLLAKFQVHGVLPITTRVVGYRAKFILP